QRTRCAHLVYISSDAVYANGDTLIGASTRPAPDTLYGQMHYCRERMVVDVAQRWSCPLMILRPCALYGPGDTHNSYGPNRFVRTAVETQRIGIFGQGEELRDHLGVEDFVRLLVLAIQ